MSAGGIFSFGKYFSWEDTFFFQGWDDKDEEEKIRILGHRLQNKQYRKPETKAEMDFTHCAGVYLLHDANRETVYVGQASSLGKRLHAHTGDHLRGRWSNYSWFATSKGVDPATSVAEKVNHDGDEIEKEVPISGNISLDTLEAILRTAMEPKLNLQSGRWGDVPEYAQSVEYEYMYLREVFEQNVKITKRIKAIKRRQ